MYEPDTILSLKIPRDPDSETGEAFPYNTVRVIGRSVVSHAWEEDWRGADSEGVMLTPESNFGSVIDEPFGKLRQLYDVSQRPVLEVVVPKLRVIDSATAAAGPTPEEVFAEEAPGVEPEDGLPRGRTPIESPLETPEPPAPSSPLGTVAPPAIAEKPKRRRTPLS